MTRLFLHELLCEYSFSQESSFNRVLKPLCRVIVPDLRATAKVVGYIHLYPSLLLIHWLANGSQGLGLSLPI